MLPLDAVVDILACSDVVADLEHAVLERKELAESVVEEGGGEGDVGGRSARVGKAEFELTRRFANV